MVYPPCPSGIYCWTKYNLIKSASKVVSVSFCLDVMVKVLIYTSSQAYLLSLDVDHILVITDFQNG